MGRPITDPIDWSVNQPEGYQAYPSQMAPALGAIAIQSGYALAAITLLALPIAAIAFARSGPAWRSIGKGPLSIEQELPPPRVGGGEPPVDPEVQEAEARQMLEARSFRRQRRGEPGLDVDAELARLLDSPAVRPGIDEALRAEVRELVVARNERRMRAGEEPLDVEAEMKRMLAPAVDVAADPALVEEVRQHVAARNARRLRQGKEPLDVEAEIRRQLEDLENLGQ